MNKKKRISELVVYLLIFALVIVGFSYFTRSKTEDKAVSFSALVTLFKEDKVKNFTVQVIKFKL